MRQQDLVDDKYEILSELGRGGFGRVFSARHLQFDRLVALKILDDSAFVTPVLRARFEREALALSTLHHRNIVTFYGYGLWNNLPYIETEFLKGETLEHRIATQGPLSLSETVEIVQQVCAGLGSAHACGIVHRDLKPCNIMLMLGDDGRETVKLIDFGLAKVMPAWNKDQQKLTDLGMAIGTVMYMSPEQCIGAEVSFSSDIYSLGCVIYSCLTGCPPFDGAHSAMIARAHVENALMPIALKRPDLDFPPGLQQVIDQCVCKSPKDRYDSLTEICEDLARVRDATFEQQSRVPNICGKTRKDQHRFGTNKVPFVTVSVIVGLGVIAASVLLHQRNQSNAQDDLSSIELLHETAAKMRNGQSVDLISRYELIIRKDAVEHRLGDGRMAQVLALLAGCYMDSRQYQLSYDRAIQALNLYKANNVALDLSFYLASYRALCALGSQKRYGDALVLGAHIVEEATSRKNKCSLFEQTLGLGNIRLQMGSMAFLAGDFDKARECLNLLPETDDSLFEQGKYTLRGELALASGRWNDAYTLLAKAKLMHSPPREWRLMPSLLRAEIATGRWEDAERENLQTVSQDTIVGATAILRAHKADWEGCRAACNRLLAHIERGKTNFYASYAFLDLPILVEQARQSGKPELATEWQRAIERVQLSKDRGNR